MAAPTRSVMRLLSPRLRSVRFPAAFAPRQVRCVSSRYSNPSQRSFTAAQAPTISFEDAASSSAQAPGKNPIALDEQQAWEQKRQYHLRRMRLAGIGLLLSVGGMATLLYNIDLDDLEQEAEVKKSKKKLLDTHKLDASDESNATFQGKDIQVIGAGDGKRIVAQGGSGLDIELVETGTSSVPHFPRVIYLPATPDSNIAGAIPNSPVNPGNVEEQEQYTLVGLGIRTVMWIQVYVIGLYIRTQDISTLQERLIHHVNPIASTLVPAEKDTLKQMLLDPQQSREIWTEILQVPGLKTAWRVSPTRNTDFSHLRDGFVTGINKRTQEARQREKTPPGSSEYDTEEFGQAVQQFKQIFAGGKAPKGSLLLLQRESSGALRVLYQANPDHPKASKQIETLGSVEDERVGRLIWLGYLGGDKVSSEAARKGVVDGCVGFASRPVGSVETMVT